jgi:ring-1,2-phenylacetyl-CoA epoxidase subunit PaaC
MTPATPDPNDERGSVYDGLLEHHDAAGDASQWAFGTDFEDPLAGVDTTVPADLDAAELAAHCLQLGDDALVLSHRLSEWCSRAPDLEDDIALSNIALDLLGQARLLLARAAAADASLVPALPEGSPVPVEDALAFFREAGDFRNVRLVEVANGDFGQTIARLLVFATVRLAAFERLASADHPHGADPVLAAIAAKGVKELTYHRDYAGRWFLTLAQGTDESRRRLLAGLAAVWPLYPELCAAYAVGPEVDVVLDQVFAVSGVERPEVGPMSGAGHTEELSRMLAEMQVVARAHPKGLW